jgi:hypothetical protein
MDPMIPLSLSIFLSSARMSLLARAGHYIKVGGSGTGALRSLRGCFVNGRRIIIYSEE